MCRICGLNIQINNIYKNIENLSKDYIISNIAKPDIILNVSDSEIDNELLKYPQFSREYHEGVVLFRKLCKKIIPFNAFFLHSAAVSFNNEGFLFCGKSGAGKSTHAILWEKTFKDAFVLNADKPLIRLLNGSFFVYGTPWCGKEGLQKNIYAKIAGVCFLEKSAENSIRKMSSKETLQKIFNQTVYMKNPGLNSRLMELLNKFITEIPFYSLNCNISKDAVYTAYNMMKPEEKNLE